MPKIPTGNKALITLGLLANGGIYHEKEIEVATKGNRASDYIHTLRQLGWEIVTIPNPKGIKGSNYQLKEEQVEMASEVDINVDVEAEENPHLELTMVASGRMGGEPDVLNIEVCDEKPITSAIITQQLNLFQPHEKKRDNGWQTSDLIGGAMDLLRKTSMVLMGYNPTKRNLSASNKVSNAMVELIKAIEILSKEEQT
jgi:hypothetical protein